MSGDTSISWADSTWNPVAGCTRVSEGCRNCYAFDVHDARHKAYQEGKLQNIPQYAKQFKEVQLLPQRLMEPLRWGRARRVFVNSMSDLFHPDVPDDYIDQVFAVMYVCAERDDPRYGTHIFQVLTKRPERMRDYLNNPERRWKVAGALRGRITEGDHWFDQIAYGNGPLTSKGIWLGTSVENQKAADQRIPALLDTPAGGRFLSCEPLLGPVHLNLHERRGIHWVIVGGESGDHARPMREEWAVDIATECQVEQVAFHFKQWGKWIPEKYAPSMISTNVDRAGSPTITPTLDTVGMRQAARGRSWKERTLFGREWNDSPEVEQ